MCLLTIYWTDLKNFHTYCKPWTCMPWPPAKFQIGSLLRVSIRRWGEEMVYSKAPWWSGPPRSLTTFSAPPRPSSAFPGSLPAGPVRARHTRPQDLRMHGPSSTFRHPHSRLNSARVRSFDHFSSLLHHWCLAHPHTEHVSWNMWMKARTNDAMRHAMTALWA